MIQRSMAKKRSGEGGFTLIELLIVIVILGILAAIVVLAIGGLAGKSKNAACNAEAKTISTAEDAYFASTADAANGSTYGTLAQIYTAGAGATNLLKDDPTTHWGMNTAPDANGWAIQGKTGTNCAGWSANQDTITHP